MLRCVLAWMSWSRTSSASDRSRANQPVGASALMTTVDTSTSSPVNEALKTGPRRQATGIRSLSPEGLSSGMDRPTPFDLVFSGLAPDHFPPIRDALVAANADLADRDAFLLTHPAMTLLREFRPDDTEAGNGLDELTALVHHAYVFGPPAGPSGPCLPPSYDASCRKAKRPLSRRRGPGTFSSLNG